MFVDLTKTGILRDSRKRLVQAIDDSIGGGKIVIGNERPKLKHI